MAWLAPIDGAARLREAQVGEPVTALAALGSRRAVVTTQSAVYLVDPDAELKARQVLHFHKTGVLGAALLPGPDGPMVATIDREGTLLLRTAAGHLLQRQSLPAAPTVVEAVPGKRVVALGMANGELQFLSVDAGSLVVAKTLQLGAQPVTHLAVEGTGRFCLALTGDLCLWICSVFPAPAIIGRLSLPSTQPAVSLAATALPDSSVKVCKLKKRKKPSFLFPLLILSSLPLPSLRLRRLATEREGA